MDDWWPTRTTLGYALLLSSPVAVGVWGGVMRGAGQGPFAPIVIAPGIVAAFGVFILVLAGATGGDPDLDP